MKYYAIITTTENPTPHKITIEAGKESLDFDEIFEVLAAQFPSITALQKMWCEEETE